MKMKGAFAAVAAFVVQLGAAGAYEAEPSSLFCSFRQKDGYHELRIRSDMSADSKLQHNWTELRCDPKGGRYRFSVSFGNLCAAKVEKVTINHAVDLANPRPAQTLGYCAGPASREQVAAAVQALRLSPSRLTIGLSSGPRARGGYILFRDAQLRARAEWLHREMATDMSDPAYAVLARMGHPCEEAFKLFADACGFTD